MTAKTCQWHRATAITKALLQAICGCAGVEANFTHARVQHDPHRKMIDGGVGYNALVKTSFEAAGCECPKLPE
jgi:hypothetical protein